MDQPLKKVLYILDASGMLVVWALELSQFILEYQPRIAIKAQASEDFMIEYSFTEPDQVVKSNLDVGIVIGSSHC